VGVLALLGALALSGVLGAVGCAPIRAELTNAMLSAVRAVRFALPYGRAHKPDKQALSGLVRALSGQESL
jgi:hypothetical protein